MEEALAAPGNLDIIARGSDMLDLVDRQMMSDGPVADRKCPPVGDRDGWSRIARDQPLDEEEDEDKLDIGGEILAKLVDDRRSLRRRKVVIQPHPPPKGGAKPDHQCDVAE